MKYFMHCKRLETIGLLQGRPFWECARARCGQGFPEFTIERFGKIPADQTGNKERVSQKHPNSPKRHGGAPPHMLVPPMER